MFLLYVLIVCSQLQIIVEVMNSSLANNADSPFGSKQQQAGMGQVPDEHPALNWFKLFFLIFLTFGLIVSMWEICAAMEVMNNGSVPDSYEAAGGLLFGLFCFYVLCFGVAWYFGSQKREAMRMQVVEQQIARQKAMEAMNNLE